MVKLPAFPDNKHKTIIRRLESVRGYLDGWVKRYNQDKTPSDREETLRKFSFLSEALLDVALQVEQIHRAGSRKLDDLREQKPKRKFFDEGKELKTSLLEYQKALTVILSDFKNADKEGVNREKTICYHRLDNLSDELLSSLLRYRVMIQDGRGEWLRAISMFHDGNRDNLIYR